MMEPRTARVGGVPRQETEELQWEVDGSPQVGTEHECLPPRGIPNLCAALQVLPCHCIGQLHITSLQKQPETFFAEEVEARPAAEPRTATHKFSA